MKKKDTEQLQIKRINILIKRCIEIREVYNKDKFINSSINSIISELKEIKYYIEKNKDINDESTIQGIDFILALKENDLNKFNNKDWC